MKNGSFKALIACFVFGVCQFCIAGGDTNIIVVSDWSEPISLRNENLHDQAIRGRLLIVSGMEPAYGGPPTANGAMTFVELQNVSGACDDKGVDICFDVMKLNCELTDATGRVIPKPNPGPWSGRGPFPPSWVRLPYNSTIRLFVNGGTREPLTVYPGGEPWCHWSIAASNTNTYFLSGTLSLSTHTNLSLSTPFMEMDYQKHGTATLNFPKTRIPAGSRPLDQKAQAVLDSMNRTFAMSKDTDCVYEPNSSTIVEIPGQKLDIKTCLGAK